MVKITFSDGLASWAGALEDYREQFNSLELQKKSLDWR